MIGVVQWDQHGDTWCNSCGKRGYGHPDQHQAVQRLRAAGWHHAAGITYGGFPYEEILCPGCAKDERKKKRSAPRMEQEALPMMQEELWTPPKLRSSNDVT